jgi:ankyrin repeat protein
VVDGDGVHESRGIPLERCADKSNLALAEMLLAHGADPNAQNDGGGSPMSTAPRCRRPIGTAIAP